MKLRHALSVTALLTGSSLAAAQEASVAAAPPVRTVVAVQPSRPATLMDHIKARQAAEQSTAVNGGTPVVMGDPATVNLNDSAVAPDHRLWFRGEFLLWRMSGTLQDSGKNTFPAIRNIMPWVTSVQNSVTRDGVPQDPLNDPLGQTINNYGLAQLNPRLFSGTNLEVKDRAGGRLTAGYWLTDEIAVEASWFQLEIREAAFSAFASGNPITFSTGLTNFTVVTNPNPPPPENVISSAQVVAAAFNAQINGTTWNRLWGGEINLRKRGYAVGTTVFDAIFGFRYLSYDEALDLAQALSVGGSGAGPGATVLGGNTQLLSTMSAQNRYYGLQVGGQFDTQIWDFSVGGRAKISVGGMNQTYRFAEAVPASVFDRSVNSFQPTAIPFEVYPSQEIRESRTRLDWVPELSAWVAYDVTSFLRLSVGYDVIFINRIMRPNGNPLTSYGNGTIQNLGTSQAVFGPAVSNFVENRLFVYGISFGAEFRY
jgi:hypothetical protein